MKLTTLLTGLFLLLSFAASSQEIKTYKAKENLYLVGDRTFSLFYITDEGVVVIDPIDERHATATMEAIKKVTDKPVTHLIYSHNHWDHISGGEIFKSQGASIISHQKAAEDIPENDNVVMPDTTWSGEKYTLKAGEKSIECYYFGANHGSGMTTFRFPEHNAIFSIDLVVPDRVLYAYLPDAKPKKWVQSLAEIQQLDFDEVYMAHVRPIGKREDITLLQQYFTDLYLAVDKELSNGTPFFDIPKTVSLPQYKHLKNYDEWLPLNVWRILMEKSIGQ
ncbi:MBL fold metallo-hydrolase [Limibacter armeniacum]|uniref:MBL fold metallo-hydrolase n=1 Tax=Limibacter armeniacum TaxID=466084 RepID=UPI002FE50FD6